MLHQRVIFRPGLENSNADLHPAAQWFIRNQSEKPSANSWNGKRQCGGEKWSPTTAIIKYSETKLKISKFWDILGQLIIDDERLKKEIAGIWPQLTTIYLSSLYLKVGEDQITDQGCEWLAKANWPHLTRINLSSLYL